MGGRLRFWDSSALLALLVEEAAGDRLQPVLEQDPDVAFWWGAVLDCVDVLAASLRRGTVTPAGFDVARGALDDLRRRAFEIQPTEEVRSRALRILRVHPLTSGGALALAAALVWCRERTTGAGFVCLDSSLRLAAAQEGFRVLPYAGEVHEPEP